MKYIRRAWWLIASPIVCIALTGYFIQAICKGEYDENGWKFWR